MGVKLTTCPWAAFRDPDVIDVLRAHDWHPNCSEYWGPDPEWWAVEGVTHYHAELARARADAIKVQQLRATPKLSLPPGFEVVDEIRG